MYHYLCYRKHINTHTKITIMKLFNNIQAGDEIAFIDSNGFEVLALVHYADDKLFRVKNLEYCTFENSWRFPEYSFYLSGKKTNTNYNYGNATRVVNRWSQVEILK